MFESPVAPGIQIKREGPYYHYDFRANRVRFRSVGFYPTDVELDSLATESIAPTRTQDRVENVRLPLHPVPASPPSGYRKHVPSAPGRPKSVASERFAVAESVCSPKSAGRISFQYPQSAAALADWL